MGYNSFAEGYITIDPPLSHAELRKHPKVGHETVDEVYLAIQESRTETASGTLISRSCDRILPSKPGDSYNRTNTEKDLASIIAAFPDHTYTGVISIIGEDGERWGYVVKDGQVIEVKPRIEWDLP